MRGLGSDSSAAWNVVAGRSRPKYRGRTGGYKGGRGGGEADFITQAPLPKPPSKRQRDMEQDEPRPSSQRSVSASPSLRRSPSSSASVAPIVADGIMGGQIRSTEPDRIREGTDGNGNGDSNATDHRPPDSDA